MEEQTLLRLSLLCSAAGLAAMFFVFNMPADACSDMGAITPEDAGGTFMVCGRISSVKVSNNHVFLGVQNRTDMIKFVIFNTSALKLAESGLSPYELRPGMSIRAPGEANEYPQGSGIMELVYRKGDIEVYD